MIVVASSLAYSVSAESEVYLTELDGVRLYNVDYNDYTIRSTPMTTFICENDDNTFMRVQAARECILVEVYDKNSALKSTKYVEYELPIFGGFYEGSENYFLVFGMTNPEENDEVEVVKVVKYTKDWERVSSVSLFGANTTIPFRSGCVRMTEVSGKLYVHTSHQMYRSAKDGLNHQANMTFVINTKDMVIVDEWTRVMNISMGSVSHSFNQFIQTDGTYVYRVEHGDAYPRSIAMTKCEVKGSLTKVSYTNVIPLDNTGETGYNATGASIGGFELSSNNCIIAGNCVDYTVKNTSPDSVRNVFVSVTDKNLKSTTVKWITNYKETDNVTVLTPQMVKINDNKFLIMWRECVPDGYYSAYSTHCVIINEKGETISPINTFDFALSDCQPVYCKDGMIRWFVSSRDTLNMFCINENGTLGCLDKKHTYGDKTTVPSTCTQTGEIYERCTKCSLKRTVQTLELAPHEEAIKSGYAPTCIMRGMSDGIYCAKCKVVIQPQQQLEATGHKYGEVQVVKEPSDREWGENKRVCEDCGYEYVWQVAGDSLLNKGDANFDGTITAVDARIILQIVAGLETTTSPSLMITDMNDDGFVTAVDARLILRKVAGL
jgi:hypothetical protein